MLITLFINVSIDIDQHFQNLALLIKFCNAHWKGFSTFFKFNLFFFFFENVFFFYKRYFYINNGIALNYYN